MRLRVFVSILFVWIARPLLASCGASSCPLDTHMLHRLQPGELALDLSLQYIDQDQPRIGTRKAQVGELHGSHHDEVRTVNRITTAALSYAPTDRLQLTLAVPFISRDHNHLGSNHGHARGVVSQHNVIPQSWSINGLGDVSLQARFNVTRSPLWIIGGVKLPTGANDLANDHDEIGELPIQPGTGTTDGIIGLSYETSPYFVTASYQFRTGDGDGYRIGNELQVNAGGAYRVGSKLDLLLQLNARVRAKDEIRDEPGEEAFTGGEFLYASPGIRFNIAGRSAMYALVQLPLYQDVNALQLTSSTNYIVGVQTGF